MSSYQINSQVILTLEFNIAIAGKERALNQLYLYSKEKGCWCCQVQTLVRCLYLLRSPVTVQSSTFARRELHNYASISGSIQTTSEKKEPCSVEISKSCLHFWNVGETKHVEVGQDKRYYLEKLPSAMPISMKFALLLQLKFFKNSKSEKQQFKVLY